MPSDPNIPLMNMDDAIKSVLTIAPQELLSKNDAQAITLLCLAAKQPDKVPREQLAYAVEWAYYVRSLGMLLDLVLAKRMTIFPQADGSMLFGGKLMKMEEAAGVVAQNEASKLIVVEKPQKQEDKDGG